MTRRSTSLVFGFFIASTLFAAPIELTSGFKIEQNVYRSGTLGGVGMFSSSTALAPRR